MAVDLDEKLVGGLDAVVGGEDRTIGTSTIFADARFTRARIPGFLRLRREEACEEKKGPGQSAFPLS